MNPELTKKLNTVTNTYLVCHNDSNDMWAVGEYNTLREASTTAAKEKTNNPSKEFVVLKRTVSFSIAQPEV